MGSPEEQPALAFILSNQTRRAAARLGPATGAGSSATKAGTPKLYSLLCVLRVSVVNLYLQLPRDFLGDING